MQGEIGYAGADPQRFLLAEVDEVSQAQSRRAGAAGRARYMPGRVPRPCADTVGCRQRARDLSEAHLGVEHVRIARALEIEVARQCLEEGEKLSFGRKQRLVVHRLQRYLRPRQAAEQVVQHAPSSRSSREPMEKAAWSEVPAMALVEMRGGAKNDLEK